MTASPGFSIRDGCIPDDEAVMIRFIDALQRFEYAMEPDRRIDPRAGADYLPHLLKRVKESDGRIFIAESEGQPVGWAVFHTLENMIYVIEAERRYGYIAELYIEEPFRGRGLGRDLIAACEGAGRALGLKLMMIGALAGNTRARKAYEGAGYAPYSLELRKYL
jgi:GNAT superfamily N-acetyltransferase